MRATFHSLLLAVSCGLPATGFAEALSLVSTIDGYEAELLSALPAPPANSLQECRTAPPELTAGKALAAAGWQVIGEAPLQGHTLVTFAASSSPGPLGLCEFETGALAIFEGDRLLGLYRSSSEAFGGLSTTEAGIVEVASSSFPVVPLAEIRHQPGGFVLQDLPASRAGCNGQVEVPQMWRAPLGRMRESLIAFGWSPLPQAAADPVSADLQASGFPETESCSGTGVNYCSYEYARPEAKLRLITVGELSGDDQPTVADYELTCEDSSR